MTRPVVLSPVYNSLTGNVSMGNLDNTFGQVAAALNELSNSSVYLVDTGGLNTFAVNPAPATVNIGQGTTLDVLISSTNTGTATLTVAGSTGMSGALPVTDGQGNALTAGVLTGNTVYRMIFDGSVWRASGTLGGGGVGPGNFTTLAASGAAVLQSLTVNNVLALAVPASGASLIVNSILAGTAIRGGDGALFWQINTNPFGAPPAEYLQFGTSSGHGFLIYTNNLARLSIDSVGRTGIGNPDVAGDTLTVDNNVSNTSMAITINGQAAGLPKLRFNLVANTGAAAANIPNTTSIATNKPGGATSVVTWIPVNYDGNLGYIPVWG